MLVIVAGLAATLASQPTHSTAASARALCGVERWTVKTLGDRPKLLPSQPTTIKYLVTRGRPASLPSTRLPFERHIFRVTAAVTLVRPESDGDFHLVLQDGAGRTMIAESPMGSCGRGAFPNRQQQMAAARARVRVCSRANVTGVAFFDFFHGQTGVAANAIELHPILAFRCLTGVVTTPRTKCAPSYPDVCIPPPPPDLDCADIRYTNFRVLWNVPDPDPHHFDGNRDGIGCQS